MSFFSCSTVFSTTFSEETLAVPGKKNGFFFSTDFNQNGTLDLLYSGFDGQVDFTRVLFQNSERFSANNYKSIPTLGNVQNAVTLDADLDGDLEIVLSEEIETTLKLQLFDFESNEYVNIPSVLNTETFDTLQIELCDYNFDAYPDLLVIGLQNGQSKVLLFENNQGNGFWKNELSLPNNTSLTYAWNKGELVWCSDNQGTAIYSLDREGELKKLQNISSTLSGKLSWVDVNNDGEYNLFVSGTVNGNAFHGFLDEAYQETDLELLFSSISEIHFADVNDDNHIDAFVQGVLPSSDARLFYIENLETGFNTPTPIDTFSTAFSTLLTENGKTRLFVSSVQQEETYEEYFLKQYQIASHTASLAFSNSLVSQEVNENQVTFSWTKVSGNNVHYRFGLSSDGGSSLGIASSDVDAYSNWKDTSITFDLAEGVYTFQVQAFDVYGNKSEILTSDFQITTANTSENLFRAVYLNNAFETIENGTSELIDIDGDKDLDVVYTSLDGQVYASEQILENVFVKHNKQAGTDLEIVSYNNNLAYYLEDGDLMTYDVNQDVTDSTGISFVEKYVLVDQDKDGDLDIFLDSKLTGTSIFYINEEGRLEQSSESYATQNSPWLVADLDNNGFDDIITQEADNFNQVAWNDGAAFTWRTLNNNAEYELIRPVDFDGDKDLDFLCYRGDDHVYFVLVNDGGTFSTSTNDEIYTQEWEYELIKNRNILIEPVNVDQDPEMEVLYMDSQRIKVYDHSTFGYYSTVLWQETHALDLDDQPITVTKQGDLNKDGTTDIFFQVHLENGETQEVILYGQQEVVQVSAGALNTSAELTYNNVTLNWNEVAAASHYVLDLYTENEVLLSSGVVNGISSFSDAFHSLDTVQQYYNLVGGKYYWQVHAFQNDIVVASSALDSFSVSSFDAVDITSISESNPNNNPGGVLFSRPCDFDNDGDLDFLFLGTRRDTVSGQEDVNFINNNFIYINQGDSTFVTQRIDIDDLYTADVEYLDYNKDGYQDLVVNAAGILLMNTHWEEEGTNGGVAQFFTKIYLNDQNNNFYDAGVALPKIGLGKIEVADYNLDGLDDLLISGRDSIFEEVGSAFDKGKGERNWYTILATNTGNGFSFDTLYTSKRNITAYFQDTDNDNDADILLLGGDYTSLESENLQWINDEGTFTPLNTLIRGYAISYTDFGDYDRDGDMDLLVLGAHINNYNYQAKRDFDDGVVEWNLSIYKNQGNNLFVPVSQNIEAYIPSTYIHQIHWLDVNNDGTLDIVLQQDNQVFMIEQTSDGSFVQAKSMHIQDQFTFSTYGDFNNDSRIDFAIGGRTSQFKVYFSNIEAQNNAPKRASRFAASIENDECSMSWENNGDDLTPSTSLRYGVVLSLGDSLVYSNVNAASDSSGFYKNGLMKKGFQLKDLRDGDYQWKITVIDDNYKSSAFSEVQSFTIKHSPTISGPADTCQFTQATYSVTPADQNYLWHVDTAEVTVIDSLTANKVELQWKSVGTHRVLVENVDFNKWDTLWVDIRENTMPVFRAELENDSSKTKMIFNDVIEQDVEGWSWHFIDQDTVLNDSVVVYDFELPENYLVGLELSYENGCVNYSEQEVLVRSPKIFGEVNLCLNEVSEYEVFPAEFNYLWTVNGGEVISTDNNKVNIAWDSDSVGKVFVTNQDLLEDGLLIDSLIVQFADTGQSNFSVPMDIGVEAEVVFTNDSELGETYSWEVNGSEVSEEMDLSYSFVQSGEYQVRLTSITSEGCETNTEKTVEVSEALELLIYNIITANGDGENDALFIENIERYPNNTVTFYNLDGQLIFEQESYQNDWQPSSDGELLKQGSYICTVKVEGFDQVFKQTISILF